MKLDLGKLVKLSDDTHTRFKLNLEVRHYGTPRTYRETREYNYIKNEHHRLCEGNVSFNPLSIMRLRRRTTAYLRRFGGDILQQALENKRNARLHH